ncbi:MAG: sugar ABC transporter substrate-binding protein, partial [Clostridia bacterium]|nr:sugar ABC transporter substrate-binding protein [Clostridia bacterium]
MKKFLCVLLAAVLLIGCASAMADEKIKLQIYGQYADDDTKVPYDYAVEKLAEAYPNVELELIPQAQDDGATLLALATAGNLPDIYQTGSGIVTTLRNSKQMMVLNDVAEKTGFLNKVYETEKQFMIADDGNI